MEKIISKSKRRKRKISKEICCPIRSQLATRKKTKLGRLSLHENWMRTSVLRIFVCFLRHITLVCRALYSISKAKDRHIRVINKHLSSTCPACYSLCQFDTCHPPRNPIVTSLQCRSSVVNVFSLPVGSIWQRVNRHIAAMCSRFCEVSKENIVCEQIHLCRSSANFAVLSLSTI